MNDEFYYIIAIFMLFSIVLSSVIADETDEGKEIEKESLNSYKNPSNDLVVAKAGTKSNKKNSDDNNNAGDDKHSHIENSSNKNTKQKNFEVEVKPKN
ncbi:hypothetical protein ALNOE001_17090 [Candidatus Methanobinarius endosymbioticus]|uniref:Uncharacterized protein n=1 Tax=Candidatus Methanobinarius endosymbioticus TaxID=2006182 RepID=A0A366M8U2_9EURY|nr:hypothetical protein ALNOE001_17090 [Candidatus Methanobinarius endosymbioticus]